MEPARERPRIFSFFPRSRDSSPSQRRSRTPHRSPSSVSNGCELVETRCSTPRFSNDSLADLKDTSTDFSPYSSNFSLPPAATLGNLIKDSHSRVSGVQQQITRLEQQEVRCRDLESTLSQQITAQYDTYIQLIVERKELALRRVQTVYAPVFEQISGYLGRLRDLSQRLERSIGEATQRRNIDIQVDSSSYELLDVKGDPLTLKLEEIREKFSNLLEETSSDMFVAIPEVRFNIDKDIAFQLNCLGHVIVDVNTPPTDDPLKVDMGIQSPYGLDIGADGKLNVLDWETNTLYLLDLNNPQNAHKCSLGRSLPRKSVHSLIVSSTGYYVSFPNKNAVRHVTLDLKCSTEVSAIDWYVFSRPHGLALTEKSNVVIADTNSNRVLICTPSLDKVLCQIKSSEQVEGQLLHPREIAVTPRQDIVVLHEGYPCIYMYSHSGELKYKFGSIGCMAKELDRPQSVSVSSDGDIFIGNVGFIGVYSSDMVSMRRVKREGVVQRIAVTGDRRVVYRGSSKDGIIIEAFK